MCWPTGRGDRRRALTVDSTSTIYEFGSMTIASGGTFSIAGAMNIYGVVTNNGEVDVTSDAPATLYIASGGEFDNNGLLWNLGAVDIDNGGTLNNNAGNGLGIGSYGVFTVDGTFNNNGGGYSTVNSLVIASDGTMNLESGSVLADWGTVTVAGVRWSTARARSTSSAR